MNRQCIFMLTFAFYSSARTPAFNFFGSEIGPGMRSSVACFSSARPKKLCVRAPKRSFFGLAEEIQATRDLIPGSTSDPKKLNAGVRADE